jgi:uncharacterized protein involved in exopolysaccharide biosynthesis
VVATALRKPEIAALGIVKARQDPDGWLRQELRVEPSENHDLITVSLSSDEPREAAAVVNAVVHTYLDEVVSAERTMKEARLAELERTYAEMELRLRKSWAEYQRLATASDPEPDPQPITQRAAEARMESMRVQFELSKAKADQQAVHELLEMIKTDPIFDEEYRPIRRDQDEEYIGRRFGNDPKARVRAKRELAEAEARWRAHGKKAADRIRQKAEIQQELKRLAARVQALTDQEKVCKAEVEKWEKELEKLGKASTNVERARADHQALKRLVAAIAEERERLKAELQAPPRVTLVSEAIPPGETE